jgi:aminopeptidase N
MFQIGENTFSRALSLYCNRYAWKNTVYQNLMECFAEAVAETDNNFDVD